MGCNDLTIYRGRGFSVNRLMSIFVEGEKRFDSLIGSKQDDGKGEFLLKKGKELHLHF